MKASAEKSADDAIMRADALAHLAAHAQPVGRVDFGETAEFAAETHRIDADQIVGIAIVSAHDDCAVDAGAETRHCRTARWKCRRCAT